MGQYDDIPSFCLLLYFKRCLLKLFLLYAPFEHHSDLDFSTTAIWIETQIWTILCKQLYCICEMFQVCALSELESHLYHQQMVALCSSVVSLAKEYIYFFIYTRDDLDKKGTFRRKFWGFLPARLQMCCLHVIISGRLCFSFFQSVQKLVQ